MMMTKMIKTARTIGTRADARRIAITAFGRHHGEKQSRRIVVTPANTVASAKTRCHIMSATR